MIDSISFVILAVLGVFLETLPFLLLGALASGLVAEFFSRADLQGLLPRAPFARVLAAALLGLFFPAGAAGAAPLARRFYRKGLPLPAVIAFWLAAPALNPAALTLTLALLGSGPLLWGQFVFGYGLGLLGGMAALLIVSLQADSAEPAQLAVTARKMASQAPNGTGAPVSENMHLKVRLRRALVYAIDDLFDFAPYLLVGTLLAALPRAFLPHNPLVSELLSGNGLAGVFLVQDLSGSLATLPLIGILAAGPLIALQSLSLAAGAVLLPIKEIGNADLRPYRAFQALVLAGLGLYILWQSWEGEIAAYTDARLTPLVILAALGCMALAQVSLAARQPILPTAQSELDVRLGHRLHLLALAAPVLLGLALSVYGGQERLRPPVLSGAEIGGRGPVTLRFDQAMDPVSVEQRFHMEHAFPGRFDWNGNELRFWPQSPLVPGQTYAVSLDAGAAAQDGRAIYNASGWQVSIRRPWIVYLAPMHARTELWRSRSDGSEKQQLTETGGRVLDFGIAPTGEWIAYSVKNDQGGIDLWQVDTAGRSSLLLACATDSCTQPSIAPDGNRVTYTRWKGGPKGQQQGSPTVEVLDRLSAAALPLPLDSQPIGDQPSWSPDGKLLAFYDIQAGGLRVVDTAGGGDTFLPSTSESSVSWSPEGRRLLYTDTETTVGQVFVIVYQANFDTGVNAPVLKDALEVSEYAAPDWSPDGEWIAVGVRLAGNLVNRQIWRMKLDGSGVQRVTSDFTYSHGSYHWSPSGQALAFQRFALNSSTSRPQVVVWDRASGSMTIVAEDAGFPAWMP